MTTNQFYNVHSDSFILCKHCVSNIYNEHTIISAGLLNLEVIYSLLIAML